MKAVKYVESLSTKKQVALLKRLAQIVDERDQIEEVWRKSRVADFWLEQANEIFRREILFRLRGDLRGNEVASGSHRWPPVMPPESIRH